MKTDDLDVWNDFIQTVSPLKRKKSLFKRFVRHRMSFKKDSALSSQLDLHLFTLQEAFTAFQEFFEKHVEQGTKKILIITGKGMKGKGVLRKEFPMWAEIPKIRKKINRVVQAPPHMGGEGAFIIYLKQGKKYVDNGN